jgi:hypothetical protein
LDVSAVERFVVSPTSRIASSTMTAIRGQAPRRAGNRFYEGDVRHRRVRGVVGEHELRSAPASAERLAFPGLDAVVRIVAAEGALADEQRPDVVDELVNRWVGPEVGVIQDMSAPWPAMNPSSDMVTEYSSLLMTASSSRSMGRPVEIADR